jgi:hypothetical protein
MRLKDELQQNPGKVKKKFNIFSQNYCALIITALEDVTPEEAFKSLDRDKVFKFIRSQRYTTDDIYSMIILREKGLTIRRIAEVYKISPKTVWSIIKVYGGDLKINESEAQEVKELSKCNGCGAQIDWIKTGTGTNMPVNKGEITVLPDKHGDIQGITGDGRFVRGKLVMEGTAEAVKVRISHFATCPKAVKFRRQ